ncbi:hypothetical protein [Radiobacillus sp. PE A8.2]|uniref:hypothetical protein n=1 Tax=Radiobacillus sp. PE A8.2 TaxID=3380349 RepID=UPI00388DC49B
MKKLIMLVLLPLVLLGCQPEKLSTIQLEDEIVKVNISESNGFYEINPNFFLEIDDENTIETITEAIITSEKQMGSVDMADPEYDMRVGYANGNFHDFHVWLGEKATLMELENTETIYYVSSEMTDKLEQLINK